MKLMKVKGSTSQILEIFIQDSSSTTGAGLTGLTNASSGLVCYYHRNTAAAGVAVSLVTMTVGTFTSSGFKEVDSTNLPGCYQLCLPDAAYATGAEGVIASLKGATNMAPLLLEVQLTGADLSNATSFGLANLPVATNAVVVATNNDKTGYTASTVSDKTGYSLTAGEHTSIATDAQTGLTAQGYTTTRAPKIDNLDATISSRPAGTDYTTARAVKLDNLDVAVSTRNSTTPLSTTQTENAVWDAVAASHTTSGSMGAKEANLDATVSSRLATSGYTTPPTVGAIRTEIDTNSTKLDAAITTRASATDYTTARAAKLDNLDAAITTRATPAQILLTPANLIKTNASNQVEASSVQGNVTGSVASVTGAVGSVTGNVTGSVGSVTAGVTVTTNNDKTGYTASTVSDKTGYSLSAGGIQAIWDALTSALTTAGSIGKRIADNLDATVSSRLATSGYTAPTTPPTVIEIRTELDTNSTKLANLDATTSSRQPSGPVTVGTNNDKTGYSLSAVGIQAVWDALTSALTTVGSIGKWITDKLDTTVSSRNSTTPPTVAAIRTEIDTNSTKLDVAVSSRASAADYTTARAAKLDNLDATISSRLATSGYTPPVAAPTVSDIWSEPIPGSYTSGQAGGKLNALGNAADPLLNVVPGGYASGTAGYALGRLVGASVSVTAPVISSGNVQIIRGDSYYSADGRALVWTLTGLPTINLTGAITTFKAKQNSSILTKTNSTTPGVTTSFSGGTLTLTVELSAADTDVLNQGDYHFDIQTLFTNSHVETWVQGQMKVVPDVR